MNQESGIRNQEWTKTLGAMCFVVVIALALLFVVPLPAFAQTCACDNSVFPNTCPASCPSDTPFCVDAKCSSVGPVIVGSTTTITFAAPTSTTTFSGFLCNVIGFINKDILPPIAVFMTLLAGFFFMLSGQDPQKATLARRIVLYTVIGVLLFLIAPGIVALIADILGATGAFAPISCSMTMTAESVTKTLINLVNWFAWLIAVASVAMGLYAGFLYLTSRGDPRKTQEAAKTLSYTIIGIAVSVLAFSIISIVKAFIG